MKLSEAMKYGAKLVGSSTRHPGQKGYVNRDKNEYFFDPLAAAHIGLNGAKEAGYIIGLLDSATTEFVAETITKSLNQEFPELFLRPKDNEKLFKWYRRSGLAPVPFIATIDVFTTIITAYEYGHLSTNEIASLLKSFDL